MDDFDPDREENSYRYSIFGKGKATDESDLPVKIILLIGVASLMLAALYSVFTN